MREVAWRLIAINERQAVDFERLAAIHGVKLEPRKGKKKKGEVKQLSDDQEKAIAADLERVKKQKAK